MARYRDGYYIMSVRLTGNEYVMGTYQAKLEQRSFHSIVIKAIREYCTAKGNKYAKLIEPHSEWFNNDANTDI